MMWLNNFINYRQIKKVAQRIMALTPFEEKLTWLKWKPSPKEYNQFQESSITCNPVERERWQKKKNKFASILESAHKVFFYSNQRTNLRHFHLVKRNINFQLRKVRKIIFYSGRRGSDWQRQILMFFEFIRNRTQGNFIKQKKFLVE